MTIEQLNAKRDELIQLKNKYVSVLRFINNIKCNNAVFIDDIINNTICIDLQSLEFKRVYNNLRLSKCRRDRFLIVKGLIPLFVEDDRLLFHYYYNNITYVFSRPFSNVMLNVNLSNAHIITQKLLNM